MTSVARALCTCAVVLLMAMIDVVAAGGAGRTEASDTVSFAAGRQAYRAEDYARAMTAGRGGRPSRTVLRGAHVREG
jgi:hypothetical protein